MESILEFMYLGVASFYQERMNEFLNVAKNLEIKEISKDVEFDDENVNNEEAEIPDNQTNLEAEPKTKTFTNSMSMKLTDSTKIQKTSEGSFNCDQCESKFTQKKNLITHIQSIHEGVKYACNQCDYQATTQGNLTIHIKSIHEGVKYPCNQCNYQARQQFALRRHVNLKHL